MAQRQIGNWFWNRGLEADEQGGLQEPLCSTLAGTVVTAELVGSSLNINGEIITKIMKNIEQVFIYLGAVVISAGCLPQNTRSSEDKNHSPVFKVSEPVTYEGADNLKSDNYIQYRLTISEVKDSIFYFSPSEDGRFYYPFGYEHIKLNEDKTTTRTSVTVERTDTVKTVILPGEEGQFYFSIPRFETASDTLVFRFIYFDNSNLHPEKVAEARLFGSSKR